MGVKLLVFRDNKDKAILLLEVLKVEATGIILGLVITKDKGNISGDDFLPPNVPAATKVGKVNIGELAVKQLLVCDFVSHG